jgi:hypothetical protein
VDRLTIKTWSLKIFFETMELRQALKLNGVAPQGTSSATKSPEMTERS